jgi:DNA-binding LytR/AlgR family response regulator
MKTTALIAEDEALLAAELCTELRQLWPDLDIVACVADGETAYEQSLALKPDVIFLDIRMPGLTGLECAQALAEDWPEADPGASGPAFPLIVFVTAYDQYAIQAFDRAAFDYVLKPVQTARLEKTCLRLQERLQQGGATSAGAALDAAVTHMRDLLANARPDAAPPNRSAAPAPLKIIQASAGNTISMVPVQDVLFFEASDKYVRVVTAEREHLIRMSLRDLLLQLDPERFWQIHRSVIVRYDAIASAKRDDYGKLTLKLRDHPEQLAVSRLYSDLFKGM